MDNTSPRVSSRVKQIQENNQKIQINNNTIKSETKVLSSTRQLKKQTSNPNSKTSPKIIPNGVSFLSSTSKSDKLDKNNNNSDDSDKNSIKCETQNKSNNNNNSTGFESPESDSMAPTISLKTPEIKRENQNTAPSTDKGEKPTRWVITKKSFNPLL